MVFRILWPFWQWVSISAQRIPFQLARGVEHFVGDSDLAHVVHQTGEVGDVLLVLGELHGLGDVGGPRATAAEWRAV